jgi:hypothetical protein
MQPEPPILEPVQLENDDPGYWEGIFRSGYEKQVFSISDHIAVKNSICRSVNEAQAKIVLIAGCGINTSLANQIANCCPIVESIICSDYTNVIKFIDASAVSSKIEYAAWDMIKPGNFQNVDCIISVNSIVSSEDRLNRKRLKNVYKCLVEDGTFIGLFPTVLVDVELLALGRPTDSVFDIRRNAVFEKAQNAWQVQYTPTLLRDILLNIFQSEPRIELMFISDDQQSTNINTIYGDTSLSTIFELYVTIKKHQA